jgi:RNA polymerase sigma factor (sigma-70 family)
MNANPCNRVTSARALSAELDGELVRRAAKGDLAALDELFHRFDRMLHCVARQVGLNDSDAADAAQDTWIRLMGNLDHIRDPSRIGSWLATTARRESTRVSMARCRQIPSSDPTLDHARDLPTDEGVDADLDSFLGDYGAELGRCLDRLPAKLLQLIRLLYSDASPTYGEVSQLMGTPIGSIGPMRQRALAMLRRELEASAGGRVARRLPDPQCGGVSAAA